MLNDEHLFAIFIDQIHEHRRSRRATLAAARTDLLEMREAGVEVDEPEVFARDYRQLIAGPPRERSRTRGLREVWPTPLYWAIFGFAGAMSALFGLALATAIELAFYRESSPSLLDAWSQVARSNLPVPRFLGRRSFGLAYLLAGWSAGQLAAGALITRSPRNIRLLSACALAVSVAGVLAIGLT